MNPMHDPNGYSAMAGERCGLGAILLLNLYERLGCGICGPNPLPNRSLKTAVQMIDPGYCLDAPELIPAGGMGNFMLPLFGDGDEPEWAAEQLTCERERGAP
jgi:hypothetical protein